MRGRVSLDEPIELAARDPGGMLGLCGALGSQLREGFRIGRSAAELPSGDGLRSIAVCGMGGSGVAGDILRSLFDPRLPVPVVVCKGYQLPEFCGRDTLVIASSFSGNTEETLATFEEAVTRGCRVVSMSGGGELAERSSSEAVAHLSLPSDVPVPRAALGYLASAPVGVLDAMGLIPPMADDLGRAADDLDRLAESLGPDRPTEANRSKSVANWLVGRTPVIWGSEGPAEAAALRWKTQMNENAKVPAFHAVLPELDHNEIEGWAAGTGHSYALVVLRHRSEHQRIGVRAEATLDAIAAAGLETREVRTPYDSTPMGALFSLIMMGDFASTYLALAEGVDPTPIPALTGLKERLRG
jgi:glucose/mannose-6-phosphate isomerase